MHSRSDLYHTADAQPRSSDFKTYLREELILRSQRNPAYSLRRFAKSIGVSPSFLSKVLNGQRRVTDKVLHKISTNLNLEFALVQRFRTGEDQTSDPQPVPEFNNLDLEYFKIISDWYHYALIELTNVAEFKNCPEWISTRLGITINQAKSAIERLLKLKLLEMKDGTLQPTTGGNTTTKNEFTHLAFKKMQNDLLQKAAHSLWNEELELRDHTSICMAIDPADIPEVKKRLAKVRREICQFLERPQKKIKKPTQVYNLSLSFFSLSKEST
jgi:uncharacterized protein (TIGR02147 family)